MGERKTVTIRLTPRQLWLLDNAFSASYEDHPENPESGEMMEISQILQTARRAIREGRT